MNLNTYLVTKTEDYKHFSFSSQLTCSMKLILLINVKMPTNVDILKVMSRKILELRVLSGIVIGLVSKLNFIRVHPSPK